MVRLVPNLEVTQDLKSAFTLFNQGFAEDLAMRMNAAIPNMNWRVVVYAEETN
jgi:hypothetical protein